VRRATIIAGLLLFVVSATLCVKAIRWDRWAHYESAHPRWYERGPWGIERYSGFKAWQFWRASWTRGLAATVISAAMIAVATIVGLVTCRRAGFSRWLLLVVLLHGTVLVYFALRWGPDFEHPAATWLM
jgi:hypothetical protein